MKKISERIKSYPRINKILSAEVSIYSYILPILPYQNSPLVVTRNRLFKLGSSVKGLQGSAMALFADLWLLNYYYYQYRAT
jgi:hypothetical protein